MISVVNVKRSDEDVYIGRGRGDGHMLNTEVGNRGWLGNPYKVGRDGTREEVIRKFAISFCRRVLEDDEFWKEVQQLGGKLGCWCKPSDCHGDVIKLAIEESPAAVVEEYDL